MTVALIAILASLLLVSVSKSKNSAERALCMGNLRQWGVAISMYAGENHNSFPDNRDGSGMSWCGTTVQSFWTNYLVPLVTTSSELDKRFHVLFCPTEKWHRAADLLTNTGYGSQLAVGYFYLPFRDPGFSDNVTHQFNYESGGVRQWVTRTQLGGEFSKAPIATDQSKVCGRSEVPQMSYNGSASLGLDQSDETNAVLKPYSKEWGACRCQ